MTSTPFKANISSAYSLRGPFAASTINLTLIFFFLPSSKAAGITIEHSIDKKYSN
jgi:hypothetical protein